MATNQEIQAWLQQQYGGSIEQDQQRGALMGGMVIGPDGKMYYSNYSSSGGNAEGEGGGPSTHLGYIGQDPGQWYEGKRGNIYDQQGNFTSDYAVEEPDDTMDQLIIGSILAMAGGAAFSGLGGAGAAAGPGEAGWGMGLDSATGGSGALEAMGGAGAGTSSMGAGASNLASDGLMNGLNGSDLMSDAFVSNGGYGAGGYGGTSGTYMGNLVNGTGSLGSQLLGGTGAATAGGATTAASAASGAGSLLGPAATILGGLAGSKGQESGGTTKSEIDPRLVPYLYGDNGLMQQTQQQLTASRSPERMAQWDQVRNQGVGLLQQPIAGNGFSLFSNRR